MKITGINNFSTTNPLQLLNEMSLKEGQKVIGKIVSLSTEEALLEIAGRPLQAKIEGNPPLVGTTQTFLVSTDEQGRIILKVLTNPQGGTENAAKGEGFAVTKPNVVPDQVLLQKAVISSLLKNNLPPTAENIEKVLHYLQDFQARYQQSMSPKVFTFIMAQKWPVTPATVLASWVYQDQEVRDILWNKLQETLPEKEAANLQKQFMTDTKTTAPELQNKLKSLVDIKLQGLFAKLKELIGEQPKSLQSRNSAASSLSKEQPESSQSDNSASASISLKTIFNGNLNLQRLLGRNINEPKHSSIPQENLEKTKLPSVETKSSDLKSPLVSVKNMTQNQTTTPTKNQTSLDPKVAFAEKMSEINELSLDQEKLKSVLEQNIAINKVILKENAVNGSSNLIPLLVNDSQTTIRECLIKWKEEKSNNKNDSVDQVVYITIPTDNMGDINLALRIGVSGTRINFRVDSEEVRSYLARNTIELKEFISKAKAVISINLKESEEVTTGVSGVDLWM